MTNSIENKEIYSFSYNGIAGDVTATRYEDPSVTWVELLNYFVTFLEVIGYVGVREKIRLEETPLTKDYWSGEFFEYDYSEDDEETPEQLSLFE